MSSNATLRWRLGTGATAGLEHVEVRIAETGIAAEAVVISGAGATAWGARWRLVVEPEWSSTRSLHLTRLGGPTVALRHDGYGEWSDGEGRRRREFQGLSDCLVEGSPFGVTQVLKRLGAKAAKTQAVDVLVVSLPDLVVARTTLKFEPLEPSRRWRVTRADGGLEVELDAEGFVTVHGDTATRVGEAETV